MKIACCANHVIKKLYTNSMSEFQTPWNPVESTTVEELLSHDSEGALRAAEYAPLVTRTDFNFFTAAASERWEQIRSRILGDPHDRAVFEDALRSQLLVDCGTGKESWIRSFAAQFGTALLFEIDIAYQRTISPHEEAAAMKIFCKKGDMLTVLARLPSACANITVNGIDRALIKNQEYHKALAHEIERVVRPGGIVFGFQSDVVQYVQSSPAFTFIHLNSVRSVYIDYFVCRKQD